MRQTYKAPVEVIIFAQSACGDTHSAVYIPLGMRLRAVVLLKIGDKLLGRVRQSELLRLAAEAAPALKYLLLARLTVKADEHGSKMTVGDGHTYALCTDNGAGRGDNHAVFDRTPDTQRLALALFILSADIRDDIVVHLGPVCEGVARAPEIA